MTDMTKFEYQVLTKTWDGPEYGAAWNVCCENCLELGWMDHFGLVTPKGQEAIQQYEEQNSER